MPEARGKKLSTESLDALIVALGLSEPVNAGGSTELNDTDTIRATRAVSNLGRKSSLAVFSGPLQTSIVHGEGPGMDAAEIFARDYLSDYDICSDFEEGYDYEAPGRSMTWNPFFPLKFNGIPCECYRYCAISARIIFRDLRNG
jgi:hypothetical protein